MMIKPIKIPLSHWDSFSQLTILAHNSDTPWMPQPFFFIVREYCHKSLRKDNCRKRTYMTWSNEISANSPI